MSDALDDLVRLRLAGYYEAGHDDPDEAEQHPHAAQPDNMPSVQDMVEERDMLRSYLGTLTAIAPGHVIPDGRYFCPFCPSVFVSGNPDVPANHSPDCRWRQAAEYIKQLEAKP